MIVVSDTSAITSLIQIGRVRILPDLFSRVLIPTTVRNELSSFHPQLPEFLQVMEVQNAEEVDALLPSWIEVKRRRSSSRKNSCLILFSLTISRREASRSPKGFR
jgi:predicted nucleic acid-binding protein